MSTQPLVQYASRTDVGMRRAANQDSLAVRLCTDPEEWQTCGHLFVVADGMGGHSVGDLASRITVDTLPMAYAKSDAEKVPDRLEHAILQANRAISAKARENPEFADMGTTCSALALSPSGAWVGHVGDSRVYRVRDGQIEQLSFDHSLQWEMIRQGRATASNVDQLHPRNVITRCLGPDPAVRIDIEGPFHVQAGDRFVLCSDGLTGHLSDTEIGAIATSLTPTEATRLLIDIANCRGGTDNVTVVVANVEQFSLIPGTQFVDAASTAPVKPGKPKPKRDFGKAMLVIFAFLATFGLILIATNQMWGIWFVCAGLILGFVRLILLTSRRKAEAAEATISGSSGEFAPPKLKSPYRRCSAKVEDTFLHFLAEAQSELTVAARENGWETSFDDVDDLHRKAMDAFRDDRTKECIQFRAKAIEELMKQLYSHARSK